jgi:hypothetical protein
MPITVRNKDRLFAKLKQLVPGIEDAVTAANRQSAEEMVAQARSLAPVKSGRLKDSIRMEAGPRPGSFLVAAGGAATTRQGNGRAYDYALGVEFGTGPHINQGMFAGSHNPGIRREPFFFPSFRLMRKRMRSRLSRTINKAVKAVAG